MSASSAARTTVAAPMRSASRPQPTNATAKPRQNGTTISAGSAGPPGTSSRRASAANEDAGR